MEDDDDEAEFVNARPVSANGAMAALAPQPKEDLKPLITATRVRETLRMPRPPGAWPGLTLPCPIPSGMTWQSLRCLMQRVVDAIALVKHTGYALQPHSSSIPTSCVCRHSFQHARRLRTASASQHACTHIRTYSTLTYTASASQLARAHLLLHPHKTHTKHTYTNACMLRDTHAVYLLNP